MNDKGEIIVYQSGSTTRLEVRMKDDTIWLTQAQIAELFGTQRQAITKHLKNIFNSDELNESSVSSILELTASDGKNYMTKIYNLDAIISIGYRVNSKNATLFRQWATQVLKDHLLKGYSVNQRMEQLEHVLHQQDKKLSEQDRKIAEHDQKIDFFIKTSLPPVEGIFYDGQLFDAYKFAADLIRSAKKSLILIDNYVDETVLLLFTKRLSGVTATIYTAQLSKQLSLDLQRHNAQYEPIDLRQFQHSHDRFLIIDEKELYHIGASLKDLGKKWFAFSRLQLDIQDLLKHL